MGTHKEVVVLNRKVLIGLLVATMFTLAFAPDAEAQRFRRFGRRGFGRGGFGGAGLAAGLLLGSALSRPYGYGYGGYGYAPVGYGYAPYAGYAAYDPYLAGGCATPVGLGYAPYGYGYGGYPYGYGYRRRSNIIPALIGGAILYSALRR
jgi:hypothetical protein